MTLRSLRWGAVWLLVAAVVVLPHMRAFSMLSKIDEYQHVDYLAKTQDLEHVEGGELVGQTAMREQACRGIDLETSLPPCRSKTFDPYDFPGHGYSHTYADPPTYYVVTGFLAAVVERVPGVDGLVTAGRSIGVLWLWAGLWLCFLLARRLGASPSAAFGATLLLAATPTVVHSVTTITTDAPLLAVGALLCLVAVDVAEGRRHWAWLGAAALLAMAVKSTALPVIGLVVLFLLLQRRQGRRRSEAELADPTEAPSAGRVPVLRAVGAVVAAALVPTFTWGVYTAATTLPAADDIPMVDIFKVDSIGWAQIMDSYRTTFSPVVIPERAPFLHTMAVDSAVQVLNLLLIVAVVGVAWFWPAVSTAGRFGTATLLALLATGPGFVLLLFFTLDVSYYIPGRYGLTVLPAAAACLALAASRRRVGDIALPVLGLAGLGLLLGYSLSAA